MNKRKIKTGVAFVFITLVLGIVLATLVIKVIQSYKEEIEVVLSVSEINAHEEIKAEQVTKGKVPASTRKADTILRPEDVIGRIARTQILSGEQIRYGHLIEEEVTEKSLITTRLTAMAGPEARAMAIPIHAFNAVGGVAKIRRGDQVDVIAIVGKEGAAWSKVIIKSAPILDAATTEDGEQYVIVAVPVEQVEELALVLSVGQWMLAINPLNATVREETEMPGMNRRRLEEKYGIVTP